MSKIPDSASNLTRLFRGVQLPSAEHWVRTASPANLLGITSYRLPVRARFYCPLGLCPVAPNPAPSADDHWSETVDRGAVEDFVDWWDTQTDVEDALSQLREMLKRCNETKEEQS